MSSNPMPTEAAITDALNRWALVTEHGSARDLRSAGAQLAELLRGTLEPAPTPESEYVGDGDDFVEGCPDCGQDTIEEDEHGDGYVTEYCSNERCGWRP